jgi:hypothetical protein
MENLTSIVIAIFTGFLAWATFKLAQHTKALSELTRSLVNIEKERDQNEARQKRRVDLKRALEAAETIQTITPKYFPGYLSKPHKFPEEHIQAIETLQTLKRYIDDADATKCLDDLCDECDKIRDKKFNYKLNAETITKDVETIQIKVLRFMKDWRRELSSAG